MSFNVEVIVNSPKYWRTHGKYILAIGEDKNDWVYSNSVTEIRDLAQAYISAMNSAAVVNKNILSYLSVYNIGNDR